MRNLSGTYVHRGDAVRRSARIRRGLLLIGFCAAVSVAATNRGPEEALAEPTSFSLSLGGEDRRLRAELNSARGDLDLVNAQLERMQTVFNYSARYRIGADLAAAIYDASLAEGIQPELAFRLVKIESEFKERATSPVGAVGLTQLMLPTARFFDRKLTRETLYDRETNLRIGFRYLRSLIEQNEGNVKLALLMYNRGPVAVNAARRAGTDPSNGYDFLVMKGYRGKALVE